MWITDRILLRPHRPLGADGPIPWTLGLVIIVTVMLALLFPWIPMMTESRRPHERYGVGREIPFSWVQPDFRGKPANLRFG